MNTSRQTAATLRREVEQSLATRVPKALTSHVRLGPERNRSGVESLDDALQGGLPIGAVTELVGEECSGRTSMALSYIAAFLQAGNVAAWVDVDDVFDPASAALCGVDWERLLWVRCASAQTGPVQKAPTAAIHPAQAFSAASGVPIPRGNGGSPHPRSEARGMDQAIQDLLTAQPRFGATPSFREFKVIGTPSAPNRPLPSRLLYKEEQVDSDRLPSRRAASMAQSSNTVSPAAQPTSKGAARKLPALSTRVPGVRDRVKHEWTALDQALKATDLVLQSGGFGLIVLDLGSTPAEMSWRIPLASWFRFRAACERTRTSLLLLTKHSCARSSAELTMQMHPGAIQAEGGVLTGIMYRSEVERARFQHAASNVLPIRKPPQRVQAGHWNGQAAWSI